jgi:hypothetical protein
MRLWILVGLCAAGCSTPQYRYVATGLTGNASESAPRADGHSEVTFRVPAAKPEGTLEVSSMGVVEVEPRAGASRVPALHLRLTASHHTGEPPWRLDTEEQRVSFPTGGAVAPSFVNSDASLPRLEVKAGELRVVDLYFALPAGAKTADDLASFTFRWKIAFDGAAAEQSTTFQRQPRPPPPVVVAPYAPYPYAPGWGPVWWGGYGYPVRTGVTPLPRYYGR